MVSLRKNLGARGRSGKGKSGALGGRGEANCLHTCTFSSGN